MVLKGYYPSMSLGFTILLAGLNIVAGCAAIVFALLILFDKFSMALGMLYVTLIALVAGLVAIFAGIFAMVGSCQESPSSIRSSSYTSIAVIVLAGAAAGYAFALSGGLADTGRHNWLTSFADEQKRLMESKYACCGWDSKAESIKTCQSALPCVKPVVKAQGKKLLILAILAGGLAAIQLLAIFCDCCVAKKMKTQQNKDHHKSRLATMEEGHMKKLKVKEETSAKTKAKELKKETKRMDKSRK